MIGNSSSGIREAAFLGVKSVNIGNRQSGRERGNNVIDVVNDRHLIEQAIRKQLMSNPLERDYRFGIGGLRGKNCKYFGEY